MSEQFSIFSLDWVDLNPVQLPEVCEIQSVFAIYLHRLNLPVPSSSLLLSEGFLGALRGFRSGIFGVLVLGGTEDNFGFMSNMLQLKGMTFS